MKLLNRIKINKNSRILFNKVQFLFFFIVMHSFHFRFENPYQQHGKKWTWNVVKCVVTPWSLVKCVVTTWNLVKCVVTTWNLVKCVVTIWNLVKCVVTFFSWFIQSRRCLCHLQILKESLGHVQIWYNTLACRQHLSHILSFNRRMCLYKNLTLTDSVWKHVQCLAAVAWEAKKPLTIETIDVMPPRAEEVGIKVLYAGVCHTLDGHDQKGKFPCVLGHEGGGDHVIPLYTTQCYECKFCKNPKTNLCQKIRVTQGQGIMPDGTSHFTCKG